MKSIGQYDIPKLINQKAKNSYAYNGHADFLVMIIELFRLLKGSLLPKE